MMDISPFLQPPASSDISDIPDHQHHQEHHQEHHHQESQEDSQSVIRTESRRHPPGGPAANKKGVKKN